MLTAVTAAGTVTPLGPALPWSRTPWQPAPPRRRGRRRRRWGRYMALSSPSQPTPVGHPSGTRMISRLVTIPVFGPIVRRRRRTSRARSRSRGPSPPPGQRPRPGWPPRLPTPSCTQSILARDLDGLLGDVGHLPGRAQDVDDLTRRRRSGCLRAEGTTTLLARGRRDSARFVCQVAGLSQHQHPRSWPTSPHVRPRRSWSASAIIDGHLASGLSLTARGPERQSDD